MTKIGHILCRLGRHEREYLIDHNDLVVVWCPTCQNPKIAEVFDAKRLPGSTSAPVAPDASDRPVAAALDHDGLSAAAGMRAAIARSDDQGFRTLAKFSDPKELVFALCFLIVDALAERGTDLDHYPEQLFDRLARR
jgi:hypothetical protein